MKKLNNPTPRNQVSDRALARLERRHKLDLHARQRNYEWWCMNSNARKQMMNELAMAT